MIIDLNCDMGETSVLQGPGQDELIMPWISSANIACGFHAGDPLTMEHTILLAIEHGLAIGAHPGYPDRVNFGRAAMKMTTMELTASLLYQIGAMKSMTETLGGKLRHVKPHGALYNAASIDESIAELIANTVFEIDNTLILYGLSGSKLIKKAKKIGLPFASEVFADRAYNDDGTLVSRSIPGSVIGDTDQVVDRAIRMVRQKKVETISGKMISVNPDTICLHGDNARAAEIARKLNEAFRKNGIHLCSPTPKKL